MKPQTKPKLLNDDALMQAAECLKVVAHPQRLKIVQLLISGSYTVGELAEFCNLPSHMTSEHLRLMQRCGFLDVRKEGRSSYYHVVEDHLCDLIGCIEKRFGNSKAKRI